MEIIPAIDISNGKCVRLYKGKKGTEKIYFKNPINALNFWMEQGAERLHFVDLDGAWGSDKNKNILKQMIEIARNKVKVQIGGGIRNIEAFKELIQLGVDRVIIGTLAIQKPEVIKKLSNEFGSEHIIVALDYREGKISTHGWTQETNKDPFTFGKKVAKLGAGYILFSAIESDGAFTGPDFENIKKMVKTVSIPIYVAGGIRNEEDLGELIKLGIHGVIIGKAFYEKKIPALIIKNSNYKKKNE
ncbi:MAG: 1-(5-phosphoribosyl)-5-[(5-phosphoribosylamino)methylideneamino]imidazole-4-carboxamide isomerase [Candidatus Lokiarchaeota archaeon]|nr:1-(5-phosphoribosyl)-5-[(5-phosphoribosylamino)methylideneamino]imidazole-4-carboxamide isomerase [Candidatus Lokiarchaeota archaeon]